MDGPAHLYNSTLIWELLWGNESLDTYFVLNGEPVPNWSGHWLLTICNAFLPAFIAEKIVLLACLAGLPIAFRSCALQLNKKAGILTYLIFPACYSFIFGLGFYNFSLALVFSFTSILFWMKSHKNKRTILWVIKLAALLLITYFSHLFVFAITGLAIGIYILVTEKPAKDKTYLNAIMSALLTLLSASALPLALLVSYFVLRSGQGSYEFLDQRVLVDWLQAGRPMVIYNSLIEETYTRKIVYVIGALSLIGAYNRINGLSRSLKHGLRFQPDDAWLAIAAVVTILYFVLPDSNGAAGFVSVRLALLIFMFTSMWIALQNYSTWLKIGVVIVTVYCHFKLLQYYDGVIEGLNEKAVACASLAEVIPPNSTVLPIDRSNDWMAIHFSNYLGSDRPLIILENYEAGTDYFPVVWNWPKLPNTTFNGLSSDSLQCVSWPHQGYNQAVPIDYVLLLGELNTSACDRQIRGLLQANYRLLESRGLAHVYEKRDR